MKVKKYTKWTLDKLKEEALKYKTRGEFQIGSPSAYRIAAGRDVLDQVCPHMEQLLHKKWIHSDITEEAKKYKTRIDFLKHNGSAYNAARRLKILDEACSHMEYICYPWTDEEVAEEALKYKTRVEFQENSLAWSVAQSRGLLDLVCSHMKRSTGTSRPEIELTNILKEFFPNLIKKNFNINIPGKPHIHRFQVDILDPETKLGIEYDGPYHHSEKGLIQYHKNWPKEDAINYHNLKDESLWDCHGIKLLHIKGEDWKADKQACIDKCLSFLGLKQKKAA